MTAMPTKSRSAAAVPPGAASPSADPSDVAPTAGAQLLERADALFRIAVETVRQHRRYACLVDHGTGMTEQRAALKLASFCDTLLIDAIGAYEKCSGKAPTIPGLDAEAWWHKANSLWHQAKEYERRHQVSDRASRMLNAQHDPAMLGELALEFDLEASALMMLQQAIDAYRKARPEAELRG